MASMAGASTAANGRVVQHPVRVPVIKIRLDELPAGFFKSEVLELTAPMTVMIEIGPKTPDTGKERREFMKRLCDETDDDAKKRAKLDADRGEIAISSEESAGDGAPPASASEKDPALAASEAAAPSFQEVTVAGNTHLLGENFMGQKPADEQKLDSEPPNDAQLPFGEHPDEATQPMFADALRSVGVQPRSLFRDVIDVACSQTPPQGQ